MEKYKYYAAVNGKLYEEPGSGWFTDGDEVVTSDGTIGKATKKCFIGEETIAFMHELGIDPVGKVVGKVMYFEDSDKA